MAHTLNICSIFFNCNFVFVLYRSSGNNYRRVRNGLPTDIMVERGDDEDEDTLYDRTESTTNF